MWTPASPSTAALRCLPCHAIPSSSPSLTRTAQPRSTRSPRPRRKRKPANERRHGAGRRGADRSGRAGVARTGVAGQAWRGPEWLGPEWRGQVWRGHARRLDGQVAPEQAVRQPVAPGPVPPAGTAPHPFPGEPSLFQGSAFGHIVHFGGSLDPVNCRVGEKVACKQPVRLCAIAVTPRIWKQGDTYLPVIRRGSRRVTPPIDKPLPLVATCHDARSAVVAYQPVLRPLSPP